MSQLTIIARALNPADEIEHAARECVRKALGPGWEVHAADHATEDERERAVEEHSDDGVEFDSHPLVSHAEDGTWVQAWVYVPNPT